MEGMRRNGFSTGIGEASRLKETALTRLVLLLLFFAAPLQAQGLFSDRAPLFALSPGPERVQSASLFGGSGAGLFAPVAPRPAPLAQPLPSGGSVAARLRDLIARAEAGRAGYDAVQYGARVRPVKRPTDMTLGEIYDWIEATPRQPHAIGRYQFIPKTLRWLAGRAGLDRTTRFTPQVQDMLADLLLGDAGLSAVQRGEMGQSEFMDNLARIWAGFPTASGRSHYHGFAGNKATISRARFEAEVRAILAG